MRGKSGSCTIKKTTNRYFDFVRTFSMTVCLSVFCFLLNGCSSISKFQNLPMEPADFNLSSEDIRSKYPEIALYEKDFRGFSYDTPLAEELIDKWGQPKKVVSKWDYFAGMGAILAGGFALGGAGPVIIAGTAAYAIRPFPPEHYFWIKERYCIESVVDRTIEHPYVRRVVYWKWHELAHEKTSEIEECRIKQD